MKLAFKVLAALLLTVVVALAAASWLIDRNVGSTYRAYVDTASRRQLEQTASQAAQLYVVQRDWAAVQAWLDQPMGQVSMGAGMGQGGMGNMRGHMQGHGPARQTMQAADRPQAILVDPASGIPLAAGGAPVSTAQLSAGAPVEIDGSVLALLVPAELDASLGSAETAVLTQVQAAIGSAALIGGLTAALLSGILAWTISRPLRALHRGVTALAAGNRQTQVTIRSRDELGELAIAFNQMAHSLQEQEGLRQRMLADIAHELRTPLSVVQGNLQAILDGVYPLAMPEIETVYAETRLLSRLVQDLHELAQAEAGRLPLERQTVDVTTALEQMATLFSPLAESKQVTLRVAAPARPVAISADPDRLQQILHNLLGNALRHTPSGGTVCLAADQPHAGRMRLSIADSGPGIHPEHLTHIFERFYRGDRSRTRDEERTAGAGLGLAIARALVEAHGGTIGVASPPGQGATFWVELPLANAAPSLG